jgi:hypothetical protein
MMLRPASLLMLEAFKGFLRRLQKGNMVLAVVGPEGPTPFLEFAMP